MKKREFNVKMAWSLGFTALLAGCMSRIGAPAGDKSQGEPYRCGRCGYLTRSKTDISGDHCPRCYAKQFEKISEAEMEEALGQ